MAEPGLEPVLLTFILSALHSVATPWGEKQVWGAENLGFESQQLYDPGKPQELVKPLLSAPSTWGNNSPIFPLGENENEKSLHAV